MCPSRNRAASAEGTPGATSARARASRSSRERPSSRSQAEAGRSCSLRAIRTTWTRCVSSGGADPLDELVGGLGPHDEVGMSEVRDELLDRRLGPVGAGGGGVGGAAAAIDDPPDPAALAVAARVLQVNLVVADDPVVEIRDV